jgi:hypothetical protein
MKIETLPWRIIPVPPPAKWCNAQYKGQQCEKHLIGKCRKVRLRASSLSPPSRTKPAPSGGDCLHQE